MAPLSVLLSLVLIRSPEGTLVALAPWMRLLFRVGGSMLPAASSDESRCKGVRDAETPTAMILQPTLAQGPTSP